MPKNPEIKSKKITGGIPSFPLVIVLVVLLFLAAAYFFIWTEYDRFAENKSNLRSQEESLHSANDYLEKLKQLLADHETIKTADKEKIALMLPNEIDEPGLFVLFENLSSKNSMAVSAIDISEKEAPAELNNFGIKEVDIAINLVGGDYNNLKNFLNDLELNLRLMDVVSINYTPEASSSILNIRTYRTE